MRRGPAPALAKQIEPLGKGRLRLHALLAFRPAGRLGDGVADARVPVPLAVASVLQEERRPGAERKRSVLGADRAGLNDLDDHLRAQPSVPLHAEDGVERRDLDVELGIEPESRAHVAPPCVPLQDGGDHGRPWSFVNALGSPKSSPSTAGS